MRSAPHLASVPQPATPSERLLTPDEVATHLRVSRGFVYAVVRRGELKAIYVGRLPRIPESALAEYLAKAGQRGGQ